MSNPNVLFFICDQLNFRCLGHKGHPVVKTPNLDRLKQDSVEFTRTYVQNAFCVPSRISYLTGQYLFHHRQYGFQGLMPEDVPSMPQFFGENGYETFHVGKAHVNPMGEHLGFETFAPTLPIDIAFSTDMNDNYQAYCQEKGYGFPTDQSHGGPSQPMPTPAPGAGQAGLWFGVGESSMPEKDSLETYTADRAIRFLRERNDDRPFFAHVSFERPHPPLSPSPEYAGLYDPDAIPLDAPYSAEQVARLPEHIRKQFENSPCAVNTMGEKAMRVVLAHYYGLITHIDHEVGKVLDVLEESGDYDNTAVVFCSDHGDFAGYKGMANKYSNTIFHDEIIRTPLLLKFPDKRHAGLEVDHLAESIDLFPTLAEVCELDTSALPLDGKDLAPIAAAAAEGSRPAAPNSAFSESYGIKVVVKDDFKFIYYVNSDEGELYDLASDSEERWNLYGDAEQAAKVAELKLEIIKKMTAGASEQRQQFIRSLLEGRRGEVIGAMNPFSRWGTSIMDGGGCWVVVRDGYRLVCVPFDDHLQLECHDPESPGRWMPCEDGERTEAFLTELINYLATKIRPISVLTGGPTAWDNMLQARGPGLC